MTSESVVSGSGRQGITANPS